MQVSTEQRELAADPGSTPRILVKVVNTDNIIDGLSARLIGVDGADFRVEPELLPLFPEGQGQIALSVDLPETHPAGRHPLTVEVVSRSTGSVHHADLELDVAARPGMTVVRTPRTMRARRSGRFVLAIANRGNVALDVRVAAAPTDAGTAVRLAPASLRVEPGTTTSVMALVRGPRMITGSEVDRVVGIEVAAGPAGAADETAPEVELEPTLSHQTTLQLRQRPLLSRGLLTFLILAAVVALWAAVFLFGLMNVFSGDPVTKSAPASFFAASADTADGDGATAAAGAPADALPKSGLLPPGVGGEITGTVTARSDGGPVGRILVEAYRTGRNGRQVLFSSGATQADGTYTLAGLFPTSYRLRFFAKGYDDVWYPDAPRAGRARAVAAVAQGSTDGVDTVVRGRPATITGRVDPGDALGPVATQVTARLLSSAGDTPLAARTTTDGAGRYQLSGLKAPGTYEISFVAPGYSATTVVQRVAGGEDRIQPTVLLSAGGGQIGGTVRDEDGPLGGVTVTTMVGGTPLSVITPTTGAVGAFDLQDLPTPGTYLITFTADGHGSRTVIVDLEAGESRTGLDTSLAAGTGSVSGLVRDPDGNGLGGVEVVVGGAATEDGTAPTTTTLTTGSVGSFTFNDLPAPGEYTLTFRAPGYEPETRPVSLAADGPASTVDIRLTTQLGRLTGAVTAPDGRRLVGATVTATDGVASYTTTSSGRGGSLPRGGYLIPSLPPGWYSVTATMDGRRPQTALVRVGEGDAIRRDLRLRAEVE